MRSTEIKGLPVVSIIDGKEIGRVRDLLINGDNRSVDYLVVDITNDYLRAYVIPYHLTEGVGVDALMIETADLVKQLNDEPDGIRLVERGVKLMGSRILTRKGRVIGKVSEYYVDEDTGRITGCEMVDMNKVQVGIIPAAVAITFGKDALVVNEDVDSHLLKDINDMESEDLDPTVPAPAPQIRLAQPPKQASPEEDAGQTAPPPGQTTAPKSSSQTKTAELFLQKQREYLLGREVKKDIMDIDGSALIQKGEIITEEIVVQATLADKFKELLHNS